MDLSWNSGGGPIFSWGLKFRRGRAEISTSVDVSNHGRSASGCVDSIHRFSNFSASYNMMARTLMGNDSKMQSILKYIPKLS